MSAQKDKSNDIESLPYAFFDELVQGAGRGGSSDIMGGNAVHAVANG